MINKAITKVNQNEFNRYENLFNTAYVVSQNILPFTDYTYQWSSFGQWSCKGTCIKFIKTISEVLLNQTIDHKDKASLICFNCVQTVTDQEAILLRKVHPDTRESATVFAIIKCLKRNRTSNFFQITCPGTSTPFPSFHTPESPIDVGNYSNIMQLFLF